MAAPVRGIWIVVAACWVAAVLSFVAAAIEPAAGEGGWITTLAGDWTVRLDGLYEIGNDPQRGGTCTVYRVTPTDTDGPSTAVLWLAEVKNVVAIARDRRFILLRTAGDYAWRAVDGGAGWQ